MFYILYFICKNKFAKNIGNLILLLILYFEFLIYLIFINI